jgi:Zn-dependent protease
MYILRLLQDPWNVFLFLLSVVVAVTVHEFAHAWSADRLGDPTARLLGRKSLDPRKHLDPWGSLLFLFVGFGWGKPVPVDSFNLRDEHKDNALIALAGPASNIAMATVAGILNQLVPNSNDYLTFFLFQFASINVFLAVFNLLPIPPLDGSKLYRAILPDSFIPVWRFLDQFGVYILLFLFLSGSSAISSFLYPIADTILGVVGF